MVKHPSYIGTSVNALVDDYSTIANNIANVNTTGYRRHVNLFQSILQNRMEQIDGQVPVGEIQSRGAIDFTQGSLVNTGRPLDCALMGKGFFEIQTPDGPRYTRNGVFQINAQGRLVDLSGRVVAGQDGPINVPRNISELSVNIAEDGSVSADGISLGRLKMVDFGDDEKKLVSVGDNCFLSPDNTQNTPAAETRVRQGSQENSNVKLMSELVDLIGVSRLYETNMSLLRKQARNAEVVVGVANS
jgi:flagellar basal-body rod protein FlgF